MNKTSMNGLLVKKGFFQGLPMVKLMSVKIYMKLVNRKRILVSGVTFMNYSYCMYLCLLNSMPPMLE